MARMVAYDEGLPVVADPGILSPQAFVDELLMTVSRMSILEIPTFVWL